VVFKLNLNKVSLSLACGWKCIPPNSGERFLIKSSVRERTPHRLKTVGDDFAIFIYLYCNNDCAAVWLSGGALFLWIVARDINCFRRGSYPITPEPVGGKFVVIAVNASAAVVC
jgi:hypothetical protein